MNDKREVLAFGPMEGITDATYRKVLMGLYPEWDFFFTDFLRAPSGSTFPERKIKEHVGEFALSNPALLQKTIVQILTPAQANYEYLAAQIQQLGVPHLDLNLGCPSKTVYGHCGGSYLLDHPKVLREMVAKIRRSFSGKFSVKMRLGVADTDNFVENLKICEGEGVDLISVHGRTKAQLYKGVANWSLIKLAKETVKNCELWGNGDIWTPEDLATIKSYTGADGFILSRSALRSPWFPLYQKNHFPNHQAKLEFISAKVRRTFAELREAFFQVNSDSAATLRRVKSLIHYVFAEFPNGEILKSQLLRSQDFAHFDAILDQALNQVLENRYSETTLFVNSNVSEPMTQKMMFPA